MKSSVCRVLLTAKAKHSPIFTKKFKCIFKFVKMKLDLVLNKTSQTLKEDFCEASSSPRFELDGEIIFSQKAVSSVRTNIHFQLPLVKHIPSVFAESSTGICPTPT